MALSDFEIRKLEKAAEAFMAIKRPPLHMKPIPDIGYRIADQSIEISEVRPHWRDESQILKQAVAMVTYVKSEKIWKFY